VERQSSAYRGVSWHKIKNKWTATINNNGKRHHLGSFEDEEQAARAYDKAARAQLGEMAQLNFPTKKEQAAEEAKQQRWMKCGETGSKYRGVSWFKKNNKWVAMIRYDGKIHFLGSFEDEEQAARAYDRAARAQHGENAQLNFPVEGESGSRKSSKYRGVGWHTTNNKWVAAIMCNGKRHCLGSFEDEEEAARAYDKTARAHHGEKVQLKFPTKKEQAAKETKQQQWIKCGEAGSKYRGVSWDKSSNKWKASITYDGKQHHLGSFEDEEEAARAHDSAARTQQGEKAQLNFPVEGESGIRKSSKYRGASWYKRDNKWVAGIKFDGNKHYLGLFEGEEEAAKAYDSAARTHQGNAAKTNFEQPADRHRGGGDTAKTKDEHMTPLSSSSLPSPRKRPRARAMIAKQSILAKKSKNKASKSSDVKAVDESKCYICNCDVPEYTSSNHKSFRLRAPPVCRCAVRSARRHILQSGAVRTSSTQAEVSTTDLGYEHTLPAFPLCAALLKHLNTVLLLLLEGSPAIEAATPTANAFDQQEQ
jgi:hypothetical protein